MRSTLDARRSILRFTALALGPEWEVRPWGVEGEFKWPFARVAPTTPAASAGPKSYADVTQTFTIHCYPRPGSTAEDSIMEVERVKELLHVAVEQGIAYQDPLVAPWLVTAQRVNTGGQLAADTYVYELTAVTRGGEESLPSDPVEVTVGGVSSSVWLGWMTIPGAATYRVYRDGLRIGSCSSADFTDWGIAADVQTPPSVCTTMVGIESGKRRLPLYAYDGVPLDGVDAFSNSRHPSDFLKVTDFSIDEGVDPEDDTQFRVIATLRVTWRRTGAMPDGRQADSQKTVQEVRLEEVVS